MRSLAALRRLLLLSTLALLVVYLVAWPVPIAPEAWNAPADAGYTGANARNERLSAMEFVAIGDAAGPEAIAQDATGRLYAAALDGKIVRLAPDGSAPTLWASTGGRPLGLAFDARSTLWVADGRRGLLAISPAGEVRVVTTEVAGTPIRLADDVDVAADGRVYFSDASTKFFAPRYSALEASLLEILEHVGTGRLLEYDPATGLTRVLVEGLVFANGVAMSHDQRSVLVAETGSYRVLRVTRDGEDRGRVEPLIENLPGFPDNVTRGRDGRYWISLVSPRNALVDRASGSPFARRLIQRLPAFVRPKPKHYGHVIAVDDSGRVMADLQDPSGKLPMLTSALEVSGNPGYLYLGSLSAPTAARVRWPLP